MERENINNKNIAGDCRQTAYLGNEGYSLVELIVSILMMSLITLMIVMFVTISTRNYQNIGSESTLQSEAQFASTYINDIAIEAEAVFQDSFTDEAGKDCTYVSFLAPDSEAAAGAVPEKYYYVIVCEKESKILRFGRIKMADVTPEADGSIDFASLMGAGDGKMNVLGNPYKLLARYVERMEIRPVVSGGMVQIALEFGLNGKSYTTTKNVACRNMR